jgi:hypothetical protein
MLKLGIRWPASTATNKKAVNGHAPCYYIHFDRLNVARHPGEKFIKKTVEIQNMTNPRDNLKEYNSIVPFKSLV